MVGKRIAIFHNLPSGGAKRSLFEWTKFLSKKNNIFLYEYTESESYLNLDLHIEEKFIYPKPKNFIHLLFLNYKMAKDIDNKNYDFIFIHHDQLMQSPALLFFLKTKSVYYCQEPSRRDEFPQNSLIGKFKDKIIIFLDKLFAKKANIILCNSTYSKEKILSRYGVNSLISPLGVSDSFYKKNTFKNKNKVKKILSAGRLHKSKGHEFIIKVLSLLNFKFKFYILCDSKDSEYKTQLIRLAKQNNITISIQSVSERKITDFYSNCDYFCAGQHNEPFGLVILEAMASGLCVFAVNEGGFIDMINSEENGFLIQRNQKLFADKINLINTNLKLKNKIVSNAITSSKHWSWANSFKKLEKIINENL